MGHASNDVERATPDAQACSFSSHASLLIQCSAKLPTIGVPERTFCYGAIGEHLEHLGPQSTVRTLLGYSLNLVWSIGVVGPHSALLPTDPLPWGAATGGAGRPPSPPSRTDLACTVGVVSGPWSPLGMPRGIEAGWHTLPMASQCAVWARTVVLATDHSECEAHARRMSRTAAPDTVG